MTKKETKRASDDALGELHSAIATELTTVIKAGEIDPETGLRKPAAASYFMAALKMLKDNNIQAKPVEGSPIQGLLESINLGEIKAALDEQHQKLH